MTDPNELILDIRNLTVRYQTDSGLVHAVEGLNLQLARGESLGFVGETGAGKTTTALSILQLIQMPPGEIVAGEIYFEGRDVMTLSETEKRVIRGGKISMIFQDPMTSLNPVIPVDRQIMEMVQLHGHVTDTQAHQRALKMLDLVGIRQERAGDYPHQFSGGMKQRVVIAIALACDPALLIADEPTTALDVTIQAQILELMKDLKSHFGTSLIMITHDLGVVAEICDKVAIMYAGSVVEYADTDSLYEHRMHPYTEGLFNSIPDIHDEQTELKVIQGTTPDPTNLPPGCPFHPRCPYKIENCTREKPAMTEWKPGHFVACPVRCAARQAGGES